MILKEIEPKTIVKRGRVVTPDGGKLNRVTVMSPIEILETDSGPVYKVRVYGSEVRPSDSPWMIVKKVYDRNMRQILL